MNAFRKKIYSGAVMLSLATGMFVTTSCQDFLTDASTTSLSTDNFYTSENNIDAGLIGVYGCLKPFSKYYFVMSEFRSDNMFNIKEAKSNEIADCAQFNSSGLLNDGIVSTCWDDHYKLISAANTLLEHLDDVSYTTAAARTQYEAETRFLRALAYFDLVRFFGRVPLSTSTISVDESFQLGQSEPKEIYDFIVSDLQFCVENLAETSFNYKGTAQSERVTKVAAKALLGKVYMQMAGYPCSQEETDTEIAQLKSNAQSLFKEVLDYAEANGKYWTSTAAEWDKMWLHDNDNKYFIFEIQYACSADQGNQATPYTRQSTTSADNYCNAYLTAGAHTYVDRDLQEHFLDTIPDVQPLTYTDKRTLGTVNMTMTQDEETGEWSGGATDANNFCTKFFEHKIKQQRLGYTAAEADAFQNTVITRTYWPQNWPVLRVEDIALLYAECVGPTTDGYKYLNRIRERAGLDPWKGLTQEGFQEAVKNERRYELLGEGQRWFDEVRQNTFVSDIRTQFINYRDKRDSSHESVYTTYANRVNDNGKYYPIPLAQIQVHVGLYTQNPGY